jgi:hypothetical protein
LRNIKLPFKKLILLRESYLVNIKKQSNVTESIKPYPFHQGTGTAILRLPYFTAPAVIPLMINALLPHACTPDDEQCELLHHTSPLGWEHIKNRLLYGEKMS